MICAVQADRILIHWLDREMSHYGRVEERTRPDVLVRALEHSFLLAVLTARSGVLVPAASLFENPRTPPVLERAAPFREAGLIGFVAAEHDPDQYLLLQTERYASDPVRRPAYATSQAVRLGRLVSPNWVRKRTSTMREIATGWTRAAELRDAAWLDLIEAVDGHPRAEAALVRVPTLLHASFVTDHVAQAAQTEGAVEISQLARDRINSIISRLYVRTHAREYGAAVMTELPFTGTDEYVDATIERLSLRRLKAALLPVGVVDALDTLSPEALLKLSGEFSVRTALDDAAVRATRPGPVFSPAERAALRPRRPLLWPPWPARTAEGLLRSRAERYVDAISRVSPAALPPMNTYNFGDHNVFSGPWNFGGKQYVVQQTDGVLAASQAVVAALLRSDEGLADLIQLDAAVTASEAVTSEQVEEAVKPQLEKAEPSRRAEIAERLATGAASGLVVQGVVAALRALGV